MSLPDFERLKHQQDVSGEFSGVFGQDRHLQNLIFGVAVQDLVGHHLQELLGLAPDVPGGWKLGSNG